MTEQQRIENYDFDDNFYLKVNNDTDNESIRREEDINALNQYEEDIFDFNENEDFADIEYTKITKIKKKIKV
jgi:hypothetical protein